MKYVYLVRAGQNHYKVGVASSVTRRLATIQTSNALPVSVVTARLVKDAYAVEKSLHRRLEDMKTDGGTEWFHLTSDEAIDLAVLMNRSPEIDVFTSQQPMADPVEEQRRWNSMINQKLDRLLDGVPALEPAGSGAVTSEDNQLVHSALIVFSELGRASTSLLQRHLGIGYGRAARVMDRLEAEGYVGPLDGIKRELIRTN